MKRNSRFPAEADMMSRLPQMDQTWCMCEMCCMCMCLRVGSL